MKKLILIFLFTPTFLFSQKEYHNWYFGDRAGITFNTADLKPINLDGDIANYALSYSVISDLEGNFKLFSSGNKLYNSKFEIISAGENIDGHTGTLQGSAMVRIGKGQYIRIGTNSNAILYPNGPSVGDISFVNIIEDNGKFTVSDKKIILKDYIGHGLLVIKNMCGGSFFLITFDISTGYYSLYKYNIKENTFKLVDKIKTKMKGFLIEHHLTVGALKSNLAGNMIVSTDEYQIEVLNLDCNKEKLTIIRKLKPKIHILSTGEFSSNGKYFYYPSSDSINTDSVSIDVITNVQNLEAQEPVIKRFYLSFLNYYNGYFLLGPNNKIYMANLYKNSLSCLKNINNLDSVSYNNIGILINGTCFYSLPNIPTTFYKRGMYDIVRRCEGEDVPLEVDLKGFIPNPKYEWTGPRNYTSTTQTDTLRNVDMSYEGAYIVRVYNDAGDEYTTEVNVLIDSMPKAEITAKPDSIVCNVDIAKLSIPNDYFDIEWTTGEKKAEIIVTKSGTYGVHYANQKGCEGYSEITVTFEKDLKMAILGETKFCKGSTTQLSADNNYKYYLWSTGETTKAIEVSQAGQYWLEATTSGGCTIRDTVDVEYRPEVQAELNPTPTTICRGDSTLLEAKYDVPYYSYEWSTGDTTRGIYVSQTGTYKLTITDTRTGCTAETEIAIKVEDNLKPTITGSNICSGGSATLTALPNDPSYTYEWSNGETSPVITVSQAGTYKVTVSKNGCSGTAEFTVNESPTPEFEILGESIICNNETATLTASKDFAEYHWSTNEISKEIVVNQAGTYTLTVTDDNGCSATKSFTVNKYELKFDISKGSIDFGKVYITETKSDKTTITNHSGFEIKLANGQLVADGQSYPFNYDFVPTQLGVFANSIVIHVIEPCDTVITIPISARVYARTTISTKDIYTQIGRTETVPVYLQCEADLPSQEYTITTDIDRSAFNTQDSYTINQNQPINKTKTKIHQLTGTILLSDKLEYDITFPNYSFTNPYIEVIEEPGKIYIDSVCIFPYRNVLFSEPTTLETNPNPATDELNISITTGVQGAMKLELVSTEGRVIYTDTWQQSTRSKELQINTRAIPSGLYQIRLITPIDAVTENVVVVE